MSEKVIVYGMGSQGLIIADILKFYDEYQLIGFLDDAENIAEKEVSGKPVLGGWEKLEECFQQGIKNIIIGIGNNQVRTQIAKDAMVLGYSLLTIVHPSSVVASDVTIGAGTVIKALVVIGPGAVIGENVTIGAQSYIGHEAVIGAGVHISGGCKIGGKTRIGERTSVGIGATVINQLQIGENAKIGAGSVVLEDVPDNQVVFGVPARPLWDRDFWAADEN